MAASLDVAVLGDFNPASVTHQATQDALRHAEGALGAAVRVAWIATPSLEQTSPASLLRGFDAIWAAPGSPYRSMDGALAGIRFAREAGRPFFGT